MKALAAEVEVDGFTELGAGCLRVLYGPQPGLAKQAFLIDEYKSLKADANRSEAEEQYLRQQFLDKLKEEEENFQTLRHCLRVEGGKLFEMERDSATTSSSSSNS